MGWGKKISSYIPENTVHDLRLLNHQYEIGDLVYVNKLARKVGKSPKLQPVWEGPFIITKTYGPVLYEVQGRKTSSVLHHDRLKSYKSDVVPGWVARFNLKDTLPMETIQEEETECKAEPMESTNQREDTHSGMQRTKRGRIIKPPDRLNL